MKKRSEKEVKKVNKEQILNVLQQMNEYQARLYIARESISYGRGGVKLMHKITKMSRTTIIKGKKELMKKSFSELKGRLRKKGGGRKRLEQKYPKLTSIINEIIEEGTSGNPMSLVKWSNKSLMNLEKEIKRRGCSVSYKTIERRIKKMNYSLQSNKKTYEGESHDDRDEQFRYINKIASTFLNKKQPVISVDTKKKELVGNFKNKGNIWRKKGNPIEVNVCDFKSFSKGKSIPYGAYDVALNKGFVNVGVTSDTSEFAVESIRQWWKQLGKKHYPKAKELLITADSGGSNGYKNRGWKYFLNHLAKETRMKITVLHFPPATSKWNKIEHRLFSFISMNWKGKPLTDYQVIINFIKNTATENGLKVYARLDKKKYEKGKKFSDEDMERIKIKYHELFPMWNYTISK